MLQKKRWLPAKPLYNRDYTAFAFAKGAYGTRCRHLVLSTGLGQAAKFGAHGVGCRAETKSLR